AGAATALLGGLLCDAHVPHELFGTYTVLLLLAFAVLFRLRERLPREDALSRTLIALFANLGLFVLFSLLQTLRLPAVPVPVSRGLVAWVCSQLLLVLVPSWVFALQTRALVLAGVQRETLA